MSLPEEKELSFLARKTKDGDKASYKTLLEKVYLLAKVYCGKRVSGDDQVDDICQEILISVHKALHTYDPKKSFLPWFYAICKYRLSDFLRNRYSNKEDISFDKWMGDQQDGHDVFKDVEKKQAIEGSLAILSEKYRDIVKLVYIEGYSISETAQKLGLGESDVKVSAHRALKQIEAKFGDKNEN